jgi:hypothetical protein
MASTFWIQYISDSMTKVKMDEAKQSINDRVAQPEIDHTAISSKAKRRPQPDLMHRILLRSSHASQDLARRMERRLNSYLLLGLLIGSLGMFFW